MNLLSKPDQELLDRLTRHPHLKERIKSLLSIAEDSEGDLETADEAEGRIIQEVRQMGQELLTRWAESRIGRVEGSLPKAEGWVRSGQKNSIGTAPLVSLK